VPVRDEVVVPPESRYKNNIMRKDIKSLLKFMNVFSIEKGFVVTEELEDEELVDGKRIILSRCGDSFFSRRNLN